MKKTIATFFVAFLLSAFATFESPLFRFQYIEGNPNSSILLPLGSIVGGLTMLVEGIAFFAVFYFLAVKMKISATKSVVASLFLGVLLGFMLVYINDMLLYAPFFGMYLDLTAGIITPSLFQYFLPAVTALLFVELRQTKKVEHQLSIVKADGTSN